ncbi:hypothetical protein VOLCADRAFT_115955 [Volvox carteri f. nagariensis]|uniref:Methyltransferase domain-containing protein n=1 Tax=Volvox carteri f. nagariensis TaxID=3068 RepID=D8TJ43_VOLCA|nr:uncharacterized protein VOLCADRAFT_115955 [Volvox carteri f. nagariensis]EFJ52311.1 hypothetical protein VOLCADRAFT_115955 [Volvox carteri f. nagariensis]|eukprot:XP_002946384.1 hypothetical protein VOLCADRAFT_115955 [Volvox carteri f. nagariensis]
MRAQPKDALQHMLNCFDAPAREAHVLLAPGCGFDYAVPDVAAALAERGARAALGRAPVRLRQVFAVRPGPHSGPVFSAKWIDALLTKPNQQPQGRRAAETYSAQHHFLAGGGAGSGASGEGITAASSAGARGAAATLQGGGCAGGTEACVVSDPGSASHSRAAKDVLWNPPPSWGPWLSYCPELHAWTIPFPLGGAAARFLFAWRHQLERQEQHKQQDQEERQQQQELGREGGAVGPTFWTRNDSAAAAGSVSRLEPEPEPELDSRIVLPLPVLAPLPPGRTALAVLAAAPLLPPLLCLCLALCWLALWLVVVPSVALLLAARQWTCGVVLLRRWLIVLSLGLLTDDEARAAQAVSELRFEMVLTAGAFPPANAPADRLAAPAAAAEAAATEAAALSHGTTYQRQRRRCQVFRMHVAGPAAGKWHDLTSACLARAALELLAAAKAEAMAAGSVRPAPGAGELAAGSVLVPEPAHASSLGRTRVEGYALSALRRGGGLITPAQLLAGSGEQCVFWDALQRDLGVEPVFPYRRNGKGVPPPRFFGVHEFLGIFVALVMGLQHALAMVGGLITPPLLISNLAFGRRPITNIPYASGNPSEIQRYLVQASLIVCGIMTFVQVAGFRIFRSPFQLGAGVLSCMGVSFTTVPIATSVINVLMKEQGFTFEEAYGKLLGTLMLCSIIPTILSFFPIRIIKKIFPPIVCGVVIMLIGVHLIAAGFKNWGGGAFCADNYLHGPTPTTFLNVPSKLANGTTIYKNVTAYVAPGVKCGDLTKTEVQLPFGSQQYIGLGFIVFFSIIFLEIFGSPFMRNASVILALLFGYLIAACIKFEGKKYVVTTKIDQAPGITFLWTRTFPIGFYAPAIVPLCIVFIITSIETVGDTAATLEASRMAVDGPDATRRIKGALLNDGVSGLFSALATSLPLTTFAQNNGVISLTNVASRQAGFAAAAWLFLLGILGKVGAWITTIPEAVLGGMTTFLFANVIASGIKIIVNGDPLTRRSRFILACSLALAFGVELVPQWAQSQLWPVTPDMSSGVRGIRDAIILVLSTSFTFGAVTALILNLIIPVDASNPTSTGTEHASGDMRGGDVSGAGGQRINLAAFRALQASAGPIGRLIREACSVPRTRCDIKPELSDGTPSPPCEMRKFGSGWGAHKLCTPPAPEPNTRCVFYSFGISDDYSFDVDLAKFTNCHGFAFDPTVVHPGLLLEQPPVSFHAIAARSLNEDLNAKWHAVTSVPALRRWQNHSQVLVIKMDCEGCEYSIARDVLAEDPQFFNHVQQFAVEIHIAKKWIWSRNHTLNLGHLYTLLDAAGLALRHASLTPCNRRHEASGCDETLLELGYPCWDGIMCQNLLFARS